jgi:small subunit ribosomal protein S14
MSAISKLQKDIKFRNKYYKYERKTYLLRLFAFTTGIDLKFRSFCFFKLSNIVGQNSSTKIKNRCLLTGRSRGVIRNFKLCRIQFKRLASEDLIPGVTKSSF